MSKTETQSEALKLSALLNVAMAFDHGRVGTDRRFVEMDATVAASIDAELRRLDAENKALRARLEAPAAPMADEREVFEEWARSQPMILDLTPRGDGYAGAFAQTTWMGWKARGAALAPHAAAKTGDAA